jgi:2-polyprenyl-6-methoxyphenol hydroxylase-like FAD-dependent oxidoreductase
VRKGEFLNVGFGRLAASTGAPFPAHAAAFRELLLDRRVLADARPRAWRGHAYRLYATPQRRFVDDGVLLVGDAAGLAYPVSGEGILTAIESGRLAARAIADAGGPYSSEHLSEYSRLVAERYGAPAPFRDEPWRLPTALVSWIGVRLMGTRWFARRVLIDRWFLHMHQPPLDIAIDVGNVTNPSSSRRAAGRMISHAHHRPRAG